MGGRKTEFDFAKLASGNLKRQLETRSVGGLTEMRRLLALLDEWKTPEPSCCFDVRLQTRLQAEGLMVFNTNTGAQVWNC